MIKTSAEQGKVPEPAATPEVPSAVGTVQSAPRAQAGGAPAVIAGRYDVERELGQGGMGRVFLAQDRKLGRKVAIKVLSGAHTADALQRFEQEARAAGSLNHPNILSVFDVGADESGPYIVSELLEGHTLRTRLAGKALPLRKALELSVQLAQGLSAAHEKGVIHRDLKLENLFISEDGRLKILDFGIAKLSSDRGESRPITQTGTVMGTVGYMSPEQVRGDHADHRADLFSFGAILYELLAGRQAFAGHTTMETGSAILHDDPAPLPGGVPEQLEAIVLRCLEKDPRDRFQSARDLAFQLESLRVTATGPRPAIGSRSRRRALFATVGTLGLALAFALGFVVHRPAPPSVPSFRRLSTLEDEPFTGRFAPDGITVLYTALKPGKGAVTSTRTDAPRSRPLGIESAFVSAISRQGEVALILRPLFFNHLGTGPGTLARMPSGGGAAREVLENVAQVDFLPDGSLVLVRHAPDEPVWTVEFPAGSPVYKSPTFIGAMRASPDGQLLAFSDQPVPGDDRGFISVLDRKGHARRLSQEWFTLQGLAWAPGGREIWFGAALDFSAALRAVTLEGKERLLARSSSQYRLLDVDPQGRALVRISDQEFALRCRAAGARIETDCSAGTQSMLATLSADGTRVLLFDQGPEEGGAYGTYLSPTDGSPGVRLGDGHAEQLSADGKWALVSLFDRSEVRSLLYPTGVGEPKPLVFEPGVRVLRVVLFPDGKRLAVQAKVGDGAPKLYVRDLDHPALKVLGEQPGYLLAVSRDEQDLLLADGISIAMVPVGGGPVREVKVAEDQHSGFAGEDLARGLLIYPHRVTDGVITVNRVPMDGGPRTVAHELRPPFLEGSVQHLSFSLDGKAYAYSYVRAPSRLYLVEGLK